jgi:hypothetical protein
MLELLKLLLDIRVISVIGPLGAVAIAEGYALYKIFKLYNLIQEKRILEWKEMKDEYVKLSSDLDKTLEAVLKVIGKNRNGN